MNHRRVQRTLFRMQLDPAFAARIRVGAPDATAGLDEDELRLLRAADPVAIAADRDERRRRQFLSNVSSEFALSIASGLGEAGFASSPELHDAVRRDASLPLAFARYADRCTREASSALRALVALETALAHARRELRATPAPKAGELALAGSVRLVEVPGGTLALAADQRAAVDAGAPLRILALPPEPDETLLVRSAPAASAFRLREVAVEHVSPALATLLRATLAPTSRASLAARLALPEADLASVVDELVRDGVLVSG